MQTLLDTGCRWHFPPFTRNQYLTGAALEGHEKDVDAIFAIVKQATAVPDEVRLNQLAVRKSDFGHRLTDLEVNRAIFSTDTYCFQEHRAAHPLPGASWRSRGSVTLCLVTGV